MAITLALELPDAEIIATDISADALALAGENAGAHQLEFSLQAVAAEDTLKRGLQPGLTFLQTDLLAGIEPASVDVVVSNPPYIADGEAAALAVEIRDHEPRTALFAGADGLETIRRLVPQAFGALSPGGALFLEIGETQGEAVKRLLEEIGFANIAVRKDLSGHDRIVSATKPAA